MNGFVEQQVVKRGAGRHAARKPYSRVCAGYKRSTKLWGTTPLPRFPTTGVLKRPPKTPDRAYPLAKNQEYACVYDWEDRHYNTVHPHKALGYCSPREFRKRRVEQTTTNAVGALRRPHAGTKSAQAVGSSPPAARSAETRSVWLDASATADQS